MTCTSDHVALVDSPLGTIELRQAAGRLAGLRFADGSVPDPRPDPAFDDVRRQLDEYFAGSRRTWQVEVDLGGTPFQREVWGALTRIPYGSTSTYGRVAAELGRPHAARAVGAANGRNPVSIVVPCHRVVGTGDALTGYAWGVGRKAALLALERAAG